MKAMKWIFWGLMLVGIGCRHEKEVSPQEITPLVGKWQQVAYERTTETGREWVTVTDTTKYNIVIFRPDGVPLYGNGKGMCCAPGTLLIDGRRFPIKPQSPVEQDELCTLIDCAICEAVGIEVNQDEMIWTSCSGYRTRYQRIP